VKYIQKGANKKNTKHDNKHQLSSYLSQDYCTPTACHAEFKVPIVLPRDAAGPVQQ